MLSPRSVSAFSPSMKTGARRRLASAGQADADVGVLALARAVDDAAHHRDLHRLDARIARLPHRHLRAQEVVDLAWRVPGTWSLVVRPQPGHAVTLGLNERRPSDCRISSATTTSCVRASPRLRRQRDADRVADAFLQQHRQRRGRGDRALGAHAGFGEAEVQRVVAAPRQRAVDADQVLHAATSCTTG